MPGLDPGIHQSSQEGWIAGSSPAMTKGDDTADIESQLMDSLNPEHPPVTMVPAQPRRRVWKFWGTALWGAFGFAALSLGQIAVVLIFVLIRGEPIGIGEAIKSVAGSGFALSLSVVAGLPATVVALWFAIRWTSTPFAEYLALRWPSWKDFLIGAVGLVVLVMGWELLSGVTGRSSSPDFMVDVMKSAQSDGALWLLILGFSVAAPVSEEFLARGFLYYGWSETFLKAPGAICLSSLVWTALHLQYYDWFSFSEVFSLGLWLGYLRYRSQSTWLTIVLHGLNNLAAVAQSVYLAGN
jgi:membrane protease YdiL (CAAX protease family)